MRRTFAILVLLFLPEAGCRCRQPTRKQWKVDGVSREALVYAPSSAKTAPSPVVFAFHGHGGTMKQAATKFAYHKHWPEAIVVYMQGLNTPGRSPTRKGKSPAGRRPFGDQNDRDLKFFDAVLATLKKDYKVDEKRIYATGHSNGGGFTYLLWAARGDVLAAVAPCAAAALIGKLRPRICPPPGPLGRKGQEVMKNLKPKPVLHMAGENDPLVRFAWQQRTIEEAAEDQRLRRGQAMGRALHHVSVQGRHAGRDVHPFRRPLLPDDVPPVIVKFFKEQEKP